MSDEEWWRQQPPCWTPLILQMKHQIDWDSVTRITYSTDYYQWLTLESWFTNLEQTPLNHSQQLPPPYKWLIDEIKHNYKKTTEELTIVTFFGKTYTNDISLNG